MKLAVLLSIQPQWCERIASGEKTVEIRKTAPKLKTPFKVYMYHTKTRNAGGGDWNHWADCWQLPNEEFVNAGGKVIGEFVCDWILEVTPHCDIDGHINQYIHQYPAILGDDCLSFEQMLAYLGNKKGFDWHISELKIYEKPKTLGEFFMPCKWYEKGDGCPEDCGFFRQDGCTIDRTDDFCEGKRPLCRPPQSWCYVEELV